MKLDRRKVYYKITNKEENHHGLQYKTGIVKDLLPFNNNPKSSCAKGGMYFTTGELLPRFFRYGSNIRPVRVLKESQVISDSKGGKFRTNVFDMKDIISFKSWYQKFFKKVVQEDLWYFPRYCKDDLKLWYPDVIESLSYEKLWYFPKYCKGTIKLWYKDIIKKMPKKDLWYFPECCNDSIELWYQDVIRRTPHDEDLWYFPAYCSDSIKLWYQDIIMRIPNEDLLYFPEYCKDSKDIWKKDYNKRLRSNSK